jgi:hypothetical protein
MAVCGLQGVLVSMATPIILVAMAIVVSSRVVISELEYIIEVLFQYGEELGLSELQVDISRIV